jgi:CspA family cold shock protein
MSSTDDVTPTEITTGCVKWFNNKAGFGFITVTDGKNVGSDIFVHHTNVNVENQQYRYLVQGEYVEFEVLPSKSDNHEWQASNVHGIKGGKLMCETRRDFKLSRTNYLNKDNLDVVEPKQYSVSGENTESSKPQRSRRPKPSQPQNENSKEWTPIKNGRGRPRKQ